MNDATVYSEIRTGKDGRQYSVRYLLTVEELEALQIAGIVGNVSEIVGYAEVTDSLLAAFERELFLNAGGVVQ